MKKVHISPAKMIMLHTIAKDAYNVYVLFFELKLQTKVRLKYAFHFIKINEPTMGNTSLTRKCHIIQL